MNKQVFRGLLADFKHRISEPMSDELKRHKDWLRLLSLNVFRQFISAEWNMTRKYVKQSCSKDFPGCFAAAYLAASLNGVLPLNYPYIVTLVNFKGDADKVCLSAIHRKKVPGIHDCFRARFVPVCCSQDAEAFMNENIERVWEFDFKEVIRVNFEKQSTS